MSWTIALISPPLADPTIELAAMSGCGQTVGPCQDVVHPMGRDA